MLKLLCFSLFVYSASGYFTLPGKCPENVDVPNDFKLADFYGKWYQAYHYSSDGQMRNNCSQLTLDTKPSGIYLNQSRVDRGLFHRYSIAKINIPTRIEDAANMNIKFTFNDAPRRLKVRIYPFRVLATNYNYYATVYTCQYSPLINKHYIYVWILSRNPILNDVSLELAVKPLSKIGLTLKDIVKDDISNCSPKYYDDFENKPTTFNYPVPI
ncbi:insecticyanin-A-like [Achroia grisella]|uniref:insecticyanin-A-like n=1 Tax=Achroia grisella TaxID=688607 RepID=UPI0027D2AD49|nr:insecticyanin-A-like [Achroia grisella]